MSRDITTAVAPKMPVLRGSKVLLRKFEEADITDAYIGWLNDPAVVRYSNQRLQTHDRESCHHYLSSFAGTRNLFVSVHALPDERAIGTMTAYLAVPHGTVDVGIMIGDKTIWGRGYGQEAWSMLVDWLVQRSDIRKVTAGTVACNVGMLRLMERSGMQPDGHRKAQEIIEGRSEDVLYFARFKHA